MTPVLERRAADLESAAADRVDLIVVGGGINGVGILLDAAARGLRALLVERSDLAAGTSSRSSKLIHGGLRYLEHRQFGLVRESVAERATLLRIAPHLVHLERFLLPITGSRREIPYVAAGLGLYDAFDGWRSARFRYVRRDRLAQCCPALVTGGMRGGFEYSDGVTDDARYVVAVARTARRLGAQLLTRVEVNGLVHRGRRVAGVSVTDMVSGESHELRAQTVVDATGAFEAGGSFAGSDSRLLPSRGAHLVIRKDRIRARTGLTLRVPERLVFLIPWQGFWLLGTTDIDHAGPIDRAVATAAEVAYLLDAANALLRTELTADDIVATFAGIRPLAGAPAASTAAVSREHRITDRPDGLITLRGGKYTTYRRVAAAVVDRVMRDHGAAAPSPTRDLRLVGAAPLESLRRIADDLAHKGLDRDVARSLVARHGTDAVAIARQAVGLGLDERLLPHLPYITAEVAWAAEREDALGIEDVLARRTRAAILDRDQAREAAPMVADVLAGRLGWTAAQRHGAEREYLEVVGDYGVPGRRDEKQKAMTE